MRQLPRPRPRDQNRKVAAMGRLPARINESGQVTELMLRVEAQRTEAAEACLEQDLRKQRPVSEPDAAENVNE